MFLFGRVEEEKILVGGMPTIAADHRQQASIQNEPDHTYCDDDCRKPVVFQGVAGVVDGKTEAARDTQKFSRYEHNRGDAEPQPDTG